MSFSPEFDALRELRREDDPTLSQGRVAHRTQARRPDWPDPSDEGMTAMKIWRDLSREAHLWYTITSADYVQHAKPYLEKALAVLRRGVANKPLAGQYPPVPYWGGVIEDILLNIDNAITLLKAGNFDLMKRLAARLMDVPRGLSESVQWLPSEQNAEMLDNIDAAYGICSKFLDGLLMSQRFPADEYKGGASDLRYENPWDVGLPSNGIMLHYEEPVYKVIGRPAHIPEYAPDTSVICKTGEIVPWTGVWVPVTGMGTAALAFAQRAVQVMQPAYELSRGFAEDEHLDADKVVDTAWHPVKRTGRMAPLPPGDQARKAANAASVSAQVGRVVGGQVKTAGLQDRIGARCPCTCGCVPS
jgi:hypothetical protein